MRFQRIVFTLLMSGVLSCGASKSLAGDAGDDLGIDAGVVVPADNAFACSGASAVQITIDGTPEGAPGASSVPLALDFVIDESGSISRFSFSELKNFMSDVVGGMGAQFSAGGSVGLVVFSTDARVVLPATNSRSTVLSAIASLSQFGGATCIGCGLEAAVGDLSRFPSEHRRMLLLITDGANTAAPQTLGNSINAAAAAGITRLVVGVGSAVQVEQLVAIAGAPQNVHQVSAYGVLPTLTGTLATSLSRPVGTLTVQVAPEFVVGTATVDNGSVAVNANRIVWNIVTGNAPTLTLQYGLVGAASDPLLVHASVTFVDSAGQTSTPRNIHVSVVGCP
jgi:hypothetical protein